MAKKSDGSEIPHAQALVAWADVAHKELKRVSQTYNRVVRYADMQDAVQRATGITTDMLMQHWIGDVLEIAAQKSVDGDEPPLTSLCVHADGTIGGGYVHAPKFRNASTARDIEIRAAEDRLLCYREFAIDLPANKGRPTLPPEVEIQRRKHTDTSWLDQLIEAGVLSVHDHVPFHNHLEVGKIFGRTYKGHQTATIGLDEFTDVWFPKIYKNDDWKNSLSQDGNVITMRHVPGGQYGSVMQSEPIRNYVITFGHVKPSSGPSYYHFLGVFESAPHLSDSTKWVHQRVSDTVTFDGTGSFTFEPTRTRPVQDDQTAEAADVDPKLVSDYQEKLNEGSYVVEDQIGNSKSRGSAQAVFAKAVKENYGWECAVTGIRTRAFLVASHIVPWREDKEIRLDPTSGICLSTFVDRAFDAGYLAITPDGRTAVHFEKLGDDPILKSELSKIDDVELAKPASYSPDPAKLTRRIELGY